MLPWLLSPQKHYFARCKRENEKRSLRGKRVVVIGGTKGIGSWIARRFSTLGADVAIVGRSQWWGNIVLDELKFNNPGPHSKYYRADLSAMREVERLTDEIIKDVKDKGGIDYLILSAGGPPTGTWKKSPEGMEKAFAVQCLSRFYTTYRLLPYVNESVVVIGSPGWGKFYDENDPGFEKPENRPKMNIINQGRRDSLYLDAIFKEFSVRNPNITFHHVFPGLIDTQALVTQEVHPTIAAIVWPFHSVLGKSPFQYADVPISKAITEANKGGLQLSGMTGWNVSLEKWAQSAENRKRLFDWSLKRAQDAAKVESVIKYPRDKEKIWYATRSVFDMRDLRED